MSGPDPWDFRDPPQPKKGLWVERFWSLAFFVAVIVMTVAPCWAALHPSSRDASEVQQFEQMEQDERQRQLIRDVLDERGVR